MPSRKHRNKQNVVPFTGTEDGIDPRLKPRERKSGGPDRKALQLCSQVARTLNGVLQGECGDECLRDLRVDSVLPFPSTARLLVTVALTSATATLDPFQVLEHLERAKGLLRGEVAAAVCRRKAPDLLFRVRGAGS
jgi:ribosome-binding factor A